MNLHFKDKMSFNRLGLRLRVWESIEEHSALEVGAVRVWVKV